MSTVIRTSSRRIRHPYVERKRGVSGGKPVIAGTRIKVTQVAMEYERLGWTPDQIVDAHPHLKLEQVHDALSYYYENQVALDADIAADEHLVSDLRRQYRSKLIPPDGG